MEKFYSAAVELQGGEHKTIRVHGPSLSAVFQQLKAMPGVRRVGKVSELSSPDAPIHTERAHHAPAAHAKSAHSKTSHGKASHDHESSAQPKSGEFRSSGPRVVIHAQRSGGLQPPPPRRKPLHPAKIKTPALMLKYPVAHAPVAKAPVAKPAAPVEVPQSTPAAVDAAADATPHEYRVTKSRRQSGDPFLLQRGSWYEAKGKRTFVVDWEKGFQDREKAEKHQAWLERTQQELSDVDTNV